MRRIFLTLILFIPFKTQALTLPFDKAAAYAVEHSPELKAARLRIEEAKGRCIASGRPQNPELEMEWSRASGGSRRSSIALLQRFPVTARLQLERSVSRAQLAAAEAEVRDGERRFFAEVAGECVKVAALQEQLSLRAQQLSNTRDQERFIKRRSEQGEAPATDIRQLELEARQLEVELLQLRITHAAALGELKMRLGVAPREPLAITGDLPGPRNPVPAGQSFANRADLEVARHEVEAARQTVKLAEANRWQDVGAGLLVENERTDSAAAGGSSDRFVGFRITVPLPVWDRNEGKIHETGASARRAALELEALAAKIQGEVHTTRGEMHSLARLVAEMDESLLPKAKELEEQLRAAYEAGLVPFIESLRARARRLELTQRRTDVLRDYHLAKVRYEAAVGGKTNAH
jgi:cobalt-zinc-cadmium efflux system outer membrane protein